MTWYEIFPRVLNMNLTASVILVFVLILRLLLKRAPKIYSYVLWSVVLFRLLCPVSLSAPVSILGVFDAPVVESTADTGKAEVVPTSMLEYIPSNIVHEEYPEITLPVPMAGGIISEAVNEKLPQGWEKTTFDPLEAPVTIATYIWMFGILCWLGYGVVSYFKLRQRLVGAMQLRGNIYLADHIQSPFVIGILWPRIYLPSDLDEQEQRYIILHEQYHIRRGDPVVKMLAFIALCIHWFNPLVWVAFLMSAKDMEMSCDEAVVKNLGEDIRADYSASLLRLATGQRILFGTPLAFVEGEPAGRIRNLARFKRPTIVVTILAAFTCVVGIILCVFNPTASHDSLKIIEQDTSVEEVVEESRTKESKAEPEAHQSTGSLSEDSEQVIPEEERYFAQWNLIAEQKDMWVTYMDYANDLQQFTIADMDGNGRLEVIVSSMGGTGSYSYTRFYEVNESFDGLTECTTDFIEGDSQPDVLSTNEPGQVFLDSKGAFHYVIRDFMRAGTEYYDIYYDVVLKNGHITHNLLAKMHDSYSTGSSVVEYTNAAGEKISEVEYLSAAETAFAGMSGLVYTFDWHNLEEIADSDAEALYTILSGIRSGIVQGNEFMEEVPEGSGLWNDETADSWGNEAVKVWMEQFGAELSENIYYMTALQKLEIGGLLPDGSEAYVSEGEAFENSVAFLDIDMDGSKELLLNVGGTCMADMGLYVYQLDESLAGEHKFRQELVIWPSATFYTNGIVTAMLSHNHGYSANDEFWPYDIYVYDKETDVYVKLWGVDAWEKRLKEVDVDETVFPDVIDTDEDGMVYRIRSEETGELILLDKEEYKEWFAELIKGAEENQIQWIEIPR